MLGLAVATQALGFLFVACSLYFWLAFTRDVTGPQPGDPQPGLLFGFWVSVVSGAVLCLAGGLLALAGRATLTRRWRRGLTWPAFAVVAAGVALYAWGFWARGG